MNWITFNVFFKSIWISPFYLYTITYLGAHINGRVFVWLVLPNTLKFCQTFCNFFFNLSVEIFPSKICTLFQYIVLEIACIVWYCLLCFCNHNELEQRLRTLCCYFFLKFLVQKKRLMIVPSGAATRQAENNWGQECR